MPQMMPINWMISFIFFIMIFIFFNIKNHYIVIFKLKNYNNKKMIQKKKNSWLW